MKTKEELVQDIMRVLQNVEGSDLSEDLKIEVYRMTAQFIHLLLGDILGGLSDNLIEIQNFINTQLIESMEKVHEKQRQREGHGDDHDPGETVDRKSVV